MPYTLDPLPYGLDALEPHISRETLDFHYNKHHAGYVTKLNGLVAGKDLEKKSLQELSSIHDPKSVPAGVYNCAAQAWNHTFYWNSLAPPSQGGGGEPTGQLKTAIEKSFGSVDAFKQKFSDAAGGHFGSGWAWLVQEKSSGNLKIVETHDAGCALQDPNVKPLLVCDVWEHAYYIDYRNARAKYVENFWKLVNWKFAEQNLNSTGKL